MAAFCDQCELLVLHLERPGVMRRARLICKVIKEDFEGCVHVQRPFQELLWDRYGISFGSSQHYIDALAQRGFLEIERYMEGTEKKRIRFVAWPRVPAGRRTRRKEPKWAARRSKSQERGLP